ncbi:retrovirus-related pol polyprotein from transposon TNT 1-94 [Tanacetum coccineum]
MSINHKKYTLVIVDEYSRHTWVHFLKKKSHAAKMIMSFIKMVENQNDVKVKQIRTDNGIEFRNSELERYLYVSKAFKVFNIRRQQIEETCHVTFDESMEAIRFTNTDVHEIGIDKSSKYPLDEFLREDDLSIQYQSNSDISYYIIPHGCSLTELTQENHVPEVIAINEQDTPHNEDVEGPPDLINTEGTQEQNVQDEQINILELPQSQSTHHESSSSYLVAQDRWSRDQHIELVNIIGDPKESMLTRSMTAKLTAASASECLFVDFLFKIELKKVSEALKYPGWIDAMQEELNQFYRNISPNLVGELVNKTLYRGMIRYMKGTLSLSLWYPKCSGFDLKGYSDSDYAGCHMER